ncbi:MAG: DNA translocase FtsK 4TM domain-containing protein [Thermoflexales bacterium]
MDTWLDVLGIGLIAITALTFFGLLSPQRSGIVQGWLSVLQRGVGWGIYVLPLLLGALGVYLLLRRFGDRVPRPPLKRTVGVALAYLVALASAHAIAMLLAGGDGGTVAQQGAGGGMVGWLVLTVLGTLLGSFGAALALAIGWAAAIMLITPFTLQQWAHMLGRALAEFEGALKGALQRAPAPTRPMPEAAAIGHAVLRQAASPALAEPQPSPEHVAQRSFSGSNVDRVPPPRIIGNISLQERSEAPSAMGGQSPSSFPEVASRLPLGRTWTLPRISEVLELGGDAAAGEEDLRARAMRIEETLRAFGVPGRVVEVNRGPTITQFGVEPGFVELKGGRQVKVKVSRIAALADDLALALAAPRVRIEAPVPGRGIVGIEVPNSEAALVSLRDVMESEEFIALSRKTCLPLALGQDVSGRPVVADLTAMPHLLIAGTTGSGKSVCVNAIINTLLCLNSPQQLRFIMIDPKRVELTGYNGIPHLLAPVVVEVEKASGVLNWVTREMDSRYRLFARHSVRNITDFNARIADPNAADAEQRPLPYIVLIIDELADLMMQAPDETEKTLCRLAQMARATGIHLIIATQRPSVDVVTGLIKANFPARIAFAVATSVDSRVILDGPGAEKLLGRGDMLFVRPDQGLPIRAQGCFLHDREIQRIVNHWRDQAGGSLPSNTLTNPLTATMAQSPLPLKDDALAADRLDSPPTWDEARAMRDAATSNTSKDDKLFQEAVATVRMHGKASISLLQRRLRIGYTRAARLIEEMEERGIVGPAVPGQQYREVLSASPSDE